MSNKLGVYFGYSFLETHASWESETISKRYFTGDAADEQKLREFLTQLPAGQFETANIVTRWSEKILNKKMGTNIALLVTEGFQNWPKIRQPSFDKRFSSQPRRAKSIVGDDYVFGLSERISGNGELLQKPDDDEIAFLHSKFQLMGVKDIALGFLHSNLNSENEIYVENAFKALGYTVHCSHRTQPEDKSLNEVARWWRCVLDAYVVEVFAEHKAKIDSIFLEFGIHTNYIDSLGESFKEDSSSYYSSQFAKTKSVLGKAEKFDELVYLGLEEFLFIKCDRTEDIYHSDFGPVGVSHTSSSKFSVQPTSMISPDHWKLFRFEEQELGFEPGPMLMGKSVTPCLLDLLFINRGLSQYPSLESLVRPGSKQKILDTFFIFIRESEFEKKLDDFLELMTKSIYKKLASEILHYKAADSKIELTGPLAPLFIEQLSDLLPSLDLKLNTNAEYIDAFCAAELDRA